ncbi:TetR/AcrR family transcriptional regulator [Nonomuraea sp. NPDC050790]|uniref:TetR/AcrR family transcriptional regulator n=1 Tax=Nonomuraea sp. NPDC050790 TaxID=3364371 RepID=UPI00379C03B9
MGKLNAGDWARAALAALAEGGLAAVAVEPVAVRLGVSKGSFYWHFANRQALVEAALAHWERETEHIIRNLEKIPDPRERLRTLLELAFADPVEAAVSFRLISDADDPAVAEVAKRVNERRMAFMTTTVAETGIVAEEAARRVLAGYASYLGVAALRRLGIMHQDTTALAALALAELLGD